MPTIPDITVASKIWEDAKAQAVGVAKLRGHGIDQTRYSPQDELLMWNAEAKGWTIENELALLAEGKSREAVGLLKYPNREKMAASGERFLDKYAQATYAADMARKADPTWTVPVPQGAQDPGADPPPVAPGYTMPNTEPPQDAGALSLPGGPTDG